MAWTYDLVAWLVSVGRWNSWVQSVANDLPGPRILELGHGPGHLQISLLQQQKSMIGLDRSRQMGNIARRNLRSNNLQYRLVTACGQHMPFPANAFDQVVATFPTEYVFQNDTLSEISRVLQSGGAFIVLPMAWITGGNILDKAAAKLFQITGQTEDEQAIEVPKAFQEVGFETHLERRQFATSLVVLIHARKP